MLLKKNVKINFYKYYAKFCSTEQKKFIDDNGVLRTLFRGVAYKARIWCNRELANSIKMCKGTVILPYDYFPFTNILVVSFTFSLFIKNIHLFILQNTLLHRFYIPKQFKCSSRILLIIKKVSSEYFNTFYESRRTFEQF